MNCFSYFYLLNGERKNAHVAPEKNPVVSAPNTTISKSNDTMTNSAGIHQSSSREKPCLSFQH